MSRILGWLALLVFCGATALSILVLWGVDLPRQWAALVIAIWLGGSALFVAWLYGDSWLDSRLRGLERVDPDPSEPVHVTPGARRFLRRRGNAVWLWRDGDRVATALAEPPIDQRFEYVPTRSGVEAYVADELLTEGGDQITVSASSLPSGIHAGKPRRAPTVVVTPLARRLIRRHGNRIWVWSDENFARTSFQAPGVSNDYELVLVDGQEIYVAGGVGGLNAAPLVLSFWPLPPCIHAVTNEDWAQRQ